jgi:hypothetical protein
MSRCVGHSEGEPKQGDGRTAAIPVVGRPPPLKAEFTLHHTVLPYPHPSLLSGLPTRGRREPVPAGPACSLFTQTLLSRSAIPGKRAGPASPGRCAEPTPPGRYAGPAPTGKCAEHAPPGKCRAPGYGTTARLPLVGRPDRRDGWGSRRLGFTPTIPDGATPSGRAAMSCRRSTTRRAIPSAEAATGRRRSRSLRPSSPLGERVVRAGEPGEGDAAFAWLWEEPPHPALRATFSPLGRRAERRRCVGANPREEPCRPHQRQSL